MKCSRVALLLLLVITTGGTANALAATDGTMAAGQQMALSPLPDLDALRQATSFQSPIYYWECGTSLPPPVNGLELPRNADTWNEIGDESPLFQGRRLSPYDLYYANDPHSGNCEDDSRARRDSPIFADTKIEDSPRRVGHQSDTGPARSAMHYMARR